MPTLRGILWTLKLQITRKQSNNLWLNNEKTFILQHLDRPYFSIKTQYCRTYNFILVHLEVPISLNSLGCRLPYETFWKIFKLRMTTIWHLVVKELRWAACFKYTYLQFIHHFVKKFQFNSVCLLSLFFHVLLPVHCTILLNHHSPPAFSVQVQPPFSIHDFSLKSDWWEVIGVKKLPLFFQSFKTGFYLMKWNNNLWTKNTPKML